MPLIGNRVHIPTKEELEWERIKEEYEPQMELDRQNVRIQNIHESNQIEFGMAMVVGIGIIVVLILAAIVL